MKVKLTLSVILDELPENWEATDETLCEVMMTAFESGDADVIETLCNENFSILVEKK